VALASTPAAVAEAVRAWVMSVLGSAAAPDGTTGVAPIVCRALSPAGQLEARTPAPVGAAWRTDAWMYQRTGQDLCVDVGIWRDGPHGPAHRRSGS
jgi:hypothetical protein